MPIVASTALSTHPSRTVAYIQLTRPYNAVVFVTTFSIGYLWTSSSRISLDYWAGIIILVLWHSLATVQNDLEDISIDRANKRTGALIDNLITAKQARKFMFLLWATAIFVALVAPQAVLHLIILAILLLVAWVYNRPPLLLSRKPLASVTIMAFCYGLAPLAYGFIVSNHKPLNYMALLFTFWFILRVSTVILKDYKDVRGDKANNKRTFYLRYGAQTTARVSIITAIIGYTGFTALLWKIRQDHASTYIILLIVTYLAIRNSLYRINLLTAKNDGERHKIYSESLFRQTLFELGVITCLLVF